MPDKAHRTSSAPKGKPSDNRSGLSAKVEKPYRDFPLTPHPTGRWCKKIKGKLHYFGRTADGWEAALKLYEQERDYLYTGRTPPSRRDGLTLLDLCNRFLHFKRQHVNEGRITLRSWYDYHETCKRLMGVVGQGRLVEDLRHEDFAALAANHAKTWGPVRRKNENNRVRILFNWGFESELLEKPMRFGPSFEPPDRKELRKIKARSKSKSGPRMFEAAELRRVLKAATQPMRSMILLGINGGMGNHDVATLPLSALDLDRGWIDFARPKTGVERVIPLWLETVSAIREWLTIRPEPKDSEDAGLVFLTKQRRPWYRLGRFVDGADGSAQVKGIDNPVAKSFRVLLDNLGIEGNRNFYALRHGFETIGGDSGDQVSVNAIMGHADQSMAATYRERIDPERLRRVVAHVHNWLFGSVVK